MFGWGWGTRIPGHTILDGISSDQLDVHSNRPVCKRGQLNLLTIPLGPDPQLPSQMGKVSSIDIRVRVATEWGFSLPTQPKDTPESEMLMPMAGELVWKARAWCHSVL